MLTFRSAVLAISGASKWVVAKPEKRGLIAVGDQPYVTTLGTVTAVGAALGDVGLSAKTDAPCAAVARLGM
jgi:hypothetical protein